MQENWFKSFISSANFLLAPVTNLEIIVTAASFLTGKA